jgi:hypothetical protein
VKRDTFMDKKLKAISTKILLPLVFSKGINHLEELFSSPKKNKKKYEN